MLSLLCSSSLEQFGLILLSAIKSLSTTDLTDPVQTGSLSRLVLCLFKCPTSLCCLNIELEHQHQHPPLWLSKV